MDIKIVCPLDDPQPYRERPSIWYNQITKQDSFCRR